MTAAPPLIRVLIAEDHSVVRQGLCALLRVDGHFTIVGEARTGREAVRLAAVVRPDVILIDIAMPVLNGLEATRQIMAANPAAKVLVLSAYSDEVYIDRMTQAGAAGFLEKQTSAAILTHAIQEVAAGHSYLSPSISKRMKQVKVKPRLRGDLAHARGARLTPREAEVLQLVAEGCANKQVAVELAISIKTVEKHRQHLMDKLDIHDTAGLTRYAIAKGIIESGVYLTVI